MLSFLWPNLQVCSFFRFSPNFYLSNFGSTMIFYLLHRARGFLKIVFFFIFLCLSYKPFSGALAAESAYSAVSSRSDHEFATLLAYGQQSWKIGHFGHFNNDFSKRVNLSAKFKYIFHIPMMDSLSFILGSSTGGWKTPETRNLDSLEVDWVWSLPGLLLGSAFIWKDTHQIMLGSDFFIEYMSIHLKSVEGTQKLIALFEPIQSAFVAYTYFFSGSNIGLHFEAHWRKSYYPQPKESANLLEDSSFHLQEKYLAMGVILHLF